MTTVIIQILIIVCLLSLRPLAMAQDFFIQTPPLGSMPPLAPITMKLAVNDDDFSAIAWRGLTVQYPRMADAAVVRAQLKHIDRALFNSFCAKPVVDENQMVREAWREAFGFDVWGPYYRVKEVEGWVKKKVSVKVFKLKGEPIIEKGRLMYTFSTKF